MMERQSALGKISSLFLAVGVCALTILACLLAYRFDNKYTSAGPRAREGVLRLDEQSLDRYPVLLLVDGWEFYNGALLTPKDFAGNNSPGPYEYIFIGQYGGFDAGYDDAPPHGSATYRLNITVPDELQAYMLELPEIFSAYRLYINGKESAGMGDPYPQSYRPAVRNSVVSFEAERSIELIFAVSDFTHFYSGMVYPPAFGGPAAVSALLNARLVFRCTLCGIVVAVGLLALLIGVLSKRKAPGVLFAMLCLFYVGYAGYPIIRTFASGYYLWYAVENISYNAMFAVVMLLQIMVCGITGVSRPREQGLGVRDQKTKARSSRLYLQKRVCYILKAGLRRLPLCLGLFACIAAIGLHIAMPKVNTRLMYAYSAFLLVYVWVAAVFITITSGIAVYRDTVNSKPLLCGALIFDCALVMDRLLPLYEPVVTGWFHELAGFMLVVTIGIAIGKELAAGYRDAAVLREREDALDRLTQMQQSYYRVLEEKATEVETSRHDLRHHYMIIDRFIKDRRYEELEAYLAESITAIDETGPETYCQNSIINVLANHYASISEQNRIHFDMRCDVEAEFGIPDAELCAILGNLFENAIDACLRIEIGRRFIKVGITQVGSLLTIRFWNSTDGEVKQTENGFLSSKREHGSGYGLESVKAIAKRYGGETGFIWNKAERVFDSTVTLKV